MSTEIVGAKLKSQALQFLNSKQFKWLKNSLIRLSIFWHHNSLRNNVSYWLVQWRIKFSESPIKWTAANLKRTFKITNVLKRFFLNKQLKNLRNVPCVNKVLMPHQWWNVYQYQIKYLVLDANFIRHIDVCQKIKNQSGKNRLINILAKVTQINIWKNPSNQ